jgi:serine/threonine protein kinase
VLRLCRQLLKCCQALHAAAIAHLDLSPSNLMLTAEGDLQVIDFGLAMQLVPTSEFRSLGTPYFRAPEVSNETATFREARAADVYSAGCCMLHLASPLLPAGLPELMKGNMDSVACLDLARTVTSSGLTDLLALVRTMLAYKAHDRPTCTQALAHPFFSCEKVESLHSSSSSGSSSSNNNTNNTSCSKVNKNTDSATVDAHIAAMASNGSINNHPSHNPSPRGFKLSSTSARPAAKECV